MRPSWVRRRAFVGTGASELDLRRFDQSDLADPVSATINLPFRQDIRLNGPQGTETQAQLLPTCEQGRE